VYSVSVLPHSGGQDAPAALERSLFTFVQEFRIGGEFKYRCVVNHLGLTRDS
jgi:hypothetical protein